MDSMIMAGYAVSWISSGVQSYMQVSQVLVLQQYQELIISTCAFDVIHSFGCHAFGFVIDAVPGKVNLSLREELSSIKRIYRIGILAPLKSILQFCL